jgi:hypothetical protein
MEKISRSKLYIFTGCILLSLIVFGRTMGFEFVWDDLRSHLAPTSPAVSGGLSRIWSQPYDGMYIPLSYSTWSVLVNLSGEQYSQHPLLFHLFNILIHGLNGFLVWKVLSKTFDHPYSSIAGALLFLVHPLQVESVSWVSEMRGLLSVFFCLLSLIQFQNFVTEEVKSVRIRQAGTSTLFFVLALLCKPVAVVFPVIVIAFCWVRHSGGYRKWILIPLIWLVLSLPSMLVTSGTQQNELMTFIADPIQRPLLFTYSCWFYITKLLLPLKLVPSYGLTPQVILAESWKYIFALIVAALAIFLFLRRKKMPEIFAGALIMLVGILPVSGLITFLYQRYSQVADRYMYLPMIGATLIFAALFEKGTKGLRAGLLVVLVLLGALSMVQSKHWKDEFSIWNRSMEEYPDQAHAAYNRAVVYGKMGRLNDAINDYSTALRFEPNDVRALENRANANAALNRFNDALADYTSAISIAPSNGKIYANRALCYYYAGDFRKSMNDLIKASELGFPVDPAFASELRRRLQTP